jgi:hypothetical protein
MPRLHGEGRMGIELRKARGLDRDDLPRHPRCGSQRRALLAGAERIGSGKHDWCTAVLEDVRKLLRMQLGVHRHRRNTGVPRREEETYDSSNA